jgi:hypothetical protein
MKIKFFENENGSGFDLTPETPAEVSQLVRMAKNTKKDVPKISVYFSGENPQASIWMKKITPEKQHNSINNH